NVQIPYEIPANAYAVLQVNNNGRTASDTFYVGTAAPGIYVDSNGAPIPNPTAAQNQIVTLFITGAGTMSPNIASGAAPANGTAIASLPAPAGGLSVEVDGIPARVTFAGEIWGLVGAVQVNYQVPLTTAVGNRSVVVKVGNVASAPA